MSSYYQIPSYLGNEPSWCVSVARNAEVIIRLRPGCIHDGQCHVRPPKCWHYLDANHFQLPQSFAHAWHGECEIQALLFPLVVCVWLRCCWHCKPFSNAWHFPFDILVTNDGIWCFKGNISELCVEIHTGHNKFKDLPLDHVHDCPQQPPQKQQLSSFLHALHGVNFEWRTIGCTVGGHPIFETALHLMDIPRWNAAKNYTGWWCRGKWQ